MSTPNELLRCGQWRRSLGHISDGGRGTTGHDSPWQADLVDSLGAPSGEASEQHPGEGHLLTEYVVTTGSAMLDQFVPWYDGVAFAFLFQ